MAESKAFKTLAWIQATLGVLFTIGSPLLIGVFTYAKTTTAMDARIDASAAQLRLERAEGSVRKDDFKDLVNEIKGLRTDVTRLQTIVERTSH